MTKEYVRKILIAVIVSFFIGFVFAANTAKGQEGMNGSCSNQIPDCSIHGELGGITYICTDTEYDYYQVEIQGAYDNVYVGDYTSGTGFVFSTQAATSRQFRFPKGSHWAQLWVGENFVGLSDSQDRECGDAPPVDTQEPMVECLGFVIEGLTEFTIDGNSYLSDNGFVSFVVPEDALWTWIMTSDGHYVMTFSQDQVGNCYIVDINYEWNINETSMQEP